MGLVEGFRKAIKIAESKKAPKIWQIQPGVVVLYCPHCGTREIWYLYKLGAAGEQSLQIAYNYHYNKQCIKSK